MRSRPVRHQLSRPAELRILGKLLEPNSPGMTVVGQLLERSARIMESTVDEYLDAYISVRDAKTPIYVSQDTTRSIVADAWSKLEEALVEANAAFNASADDPHERILTLLQAANEVVRYADVIYVLTPMSESDLSQ